MTWSPLHWGRTLWLAVAAIVGFMLWRWHARSANGAVARMLAARDADSAAVHYEDAQAAKARAYGARDSAQRQLKQLRGNGHESMATKIERLNRL